MEQLFTVADLRREMSLSLEEFGKRIGLASKGGTSVLERENRCSPRVALNIEALSGGRISASDLNDIVRDSRERVHAAPDTHGAIAPSPGIDADNSPSQESEAA